MTVKMPEPITAPMPSAVSDHGPSVFLSACSGSSESRMSLSIDLRASSWLGSAVLLAKTVVSDQWSVVSGFREALESYSSYPEMREILSNRIELTTDH